MLLFSGETFIIIGVVILSLLRISLRIPLVAVAVNAMTLT